MFIIDTTKQFFILRLKLALHWQSNEFNPSTQCVLFCGQTIPSQSLIFVSHRWPVKPGWHVQRNTTLSFSRIGWHWVALFEHGCDKHGSSV
jgi:hypothetical protein